MAGDNVVSQDGSANNANNARNYKCCRTKPYSSVTCISCGAVYHISCANRIKYIQIDESRIKCCDTPVNPSGINNVDLNRADAETSEIFTKVKLLEQENDFLRQIYEQVEDKNHILKENNGLLVEKIQYLQKIIQDLSTKNEVVRETRGSRSGISISSENYNDHQRQRQTTTVPRHRNQSNSGGTAIIFNPASQNRVEVEKTAAERNDSGKVNAVNFNRSQRQVDDSSYLQYVNTGDIIINSESRQSGQQDKQNIIKNKNARTYQGQGCEAVDATMVPNPQYSERISSRSAVPAADGFIDVRRRKRKKNAHVGTAVLNGDSDAEFQARSSKRPEDRKIWLFISKAKDSVTQDIVRDYIAAKGEVDKSDIEVKLLQTRTSYKDNNCFLIGVPLTMKEKVYESGFWPTGIRYERFDFRMGRQFLNKEDDI